MKQKFFAVVLSLTIAFGYVSFAVAGEVGSADSKFMFGNDNAAATTISASEMQQTAGNLIPVAMPALDTASGALTTGTNLLPVVNNATGLLPTGNSAVGTALLVQELLPLPLPL